MSRQDSRARLAMRLKVDDDVCPLLKEAAYVAGEWISDPADRIEVTNPADGTTVGSVPVLTADHVDQAIAGALRSWGSWKAARTDERAVVLQDWARLIGEHRESLARLMTLEQGKPIAESRAEIDYAYSFIPWFAEEARRQYGTIIPSHLPESRLYVTREPVGTVAAITPWNFPSAMVTRKAAAALAAGCPVIVLPSCHTPFSAIALAALAEEAGLPDGVLSVLTGDTSANVRQLCSSSDVRALSFTGSTEVGRMLMQQSAASIKKVSLELGGHAPFIVFEDADIAKAVDGCIKAKFTTGGQDCLAANRIYVQRDVYAEFAHRFTEVAATLRVGPGFSDGVDIGPLIHVRAVKKCDAHVNDALSKGATLLHAGGVKEPGTLFYHPTVLGDVVDSMKIYREETFGPVAPLTPFDNDADIVQMANDTIYGLAAYVYTNDIARAWKISESLEYGMIALNTPRMTGAPVPFGGYKQSGLGREGSHFGIDEFTESKYYCWNQG